MKKNPFAQFRKLEERIVLSGGCTDECGKNLEEIDSCVFDIPLFDNIMRGEYPDKVTCQENQERIKKAINEFHTIIKNECDSCKEIHLKLAKELINKHEPIMLEENCQECKNFQLTQIEEIKDLYAFPSLEQISTNASSLQVSQVSQEQRKTDAKAEPKEKEDVVLPFAVDESIKPLLNDERRIEETKSEEIKESVEQLNASSLDEDPGQDLEKLNPFKKKRVEPEVEGEEILPVVEQKYSSPSPSDLGTSPRLLQKELGKSRLRTPSVGKLINYLRIW